MEKITAFIARSFASRDEQKIQPILKHLDSFRDLGFVWKSAEPAEAERVSAKVCRIIAGCDVFIGILTKRHPIYDALPFSKGIWKALRGEPKPARWSPPAWVIQESGYALGLERKIILFVEPELDLPFLQGDLEYIPYDYTSPAAAFTKASEMINKLVAATAGITVETIVRQEVPASDKAIEARSEPETAAISKEPEPAEPSLRDLITGVFEATERRDWDKVDELYHAGLKLIENGGAKIKALTWQCFCLRVQYTSGDSSALDKLKTLEHTNQNESDPPLALAVALLSFKEYEAAAEYYQRAASLSQGSSASSYLLKAADALTEAKLKDRAERILGKLLGKADGTDQLEAAQKLYELLKSSGRHFAAFGIAELALRRNPGLRDLRFNLGLHYHEQGLHELFLHHYKMLDEHEPGSENIIHNLAIACSECNLHIACVDHYKHAIELGGTLASSNLGHKYLDAGMADEARTLLLDALKKPDCAPEVGNCLATIAEREKQESEGEKVSLAAADSQRVFLTAIGEGLYGEACPTIAGLWRMPFGEMELTREGDQLTGLAETEEPSPHRHWLALNALSGATMYPGRYEFRGEMEGRVCKFELTSGPRKSTTILGGITSTRQGYMVFAATGDSAVYAEVEGKKLSKHRTVERLLRPVSAPPSVS